MSSAVILLSTMMLLSLGVWGIRRELATNFLLVQSGEYNRSALRFGRTYKILAWLVLNLLILASLISSFMEFLSEPRFF